MGPSIIARNYAETLLALAQRHGGDATVDEFGRAIDEVAQLVRSDARVPAFLATPRVDAEAKKQVLRSTLAGRVPELFLRFLMVVVEKRRQGLLREIAVEYRALVDALRGRVRAEVTLAREPDPELERDVVASLERRLGKTVLARFRVDPTLIGGVVIRVGDRVLDGSLRSRVQGLRRRMLTARLPRAAT